MFSIYRFFVSLGRYIPKYFTLFIAMVNGIVSLISFSTFSLLVYRNARDFCVPVPYCLDDCGFVVEPEVRLVDSSSYILLSQDCFGYSKFFCISIQIVKLFVLAL